MFSQGPKQPLDDCRDAILDRLAKVRSLVGESLAAEHDITIATIADDITADLINLAPRLLTEISDGEVHAGEALDGLKRVAPWCFAAEISSHQATPMIMQMSGTPDQAYARGQAEALSAAALRRVHVAYLKHCHDKGIEPRPLRPLHPSEPETMQTKQNRLNAARVADVEPASGPTGDIVSEPACNAVDIRDFSERRHRQPVA